ncbi:MAG: glucose-6-phosphate isomerase [Sulfurovum sp.]|nr:MAG: glucose-6-phosphate isomerase [Sulfurovum sp.]
MLKFSESFNFHSNSNDELIMKKAMTTVQNEMQSNTIGYYKLPLDSCTHLENIKNLDTNDIKQLVIMGIGGSSLGIKAIASMLSPYTKNTKEILFLENSDPITITDTLKKIKKDEALFFIISKSGSTIETTSMLKTVIGYCKLELEGQDSKRLIVITDKGSVLSTFAQHYKLKEFNIPDNVGGRFSVLSAVGVVPLALAGFDMTGVLKGAEIFTKNFFDAKENHILQKAVYLYKNAKNESINVLFSYADNLENFTKWYVQLWGESLGKIDINGNKVGLTPIGLTGAVDQHSFLQLIIEGPENKNVTFINIEDFQVDLDIPNISLYGIEKTDFINGQSFNTLINAQCDATMQSLIDENISTDMITLDKISAKNIGKLIAYYEILTSLVGAMLEVDTYNQPGVELGKQILYRNLEK